MKEKDLERRFCKYAKEQGVLAHKLSTQGSRGTAGWPDRMLLFDGGRTVFFEFKAPGKPKHFTPLQLLRATELRSLNFEVQIHNDLDEACAALDALL